jgi:hypothetical protein
LDLIRMWINQPSTLQAYHKWHCENVLVQSKEWHDKSLSHVQCWLTSKTDLVSMQISKLALSQGWQGMPIPQPTVTVSSVASASMTDIACEKIKNKGHNVFLHSIGDSSGRYKFVCYECKMTLNYHEGEWFGMAIDNDCPKNTVILS